MAYAKTSLRKEKRELREKMRAMGLHYRDIAAEFTRRYRLRPRAAWREAYGWSLQETADRINEFRGDIGLDPGGFAGMTASHLCEYESWPGHGSEPSGRRPTPYLLALLAAVYNCGAIDLIDLADREHLLPAQLLILDQYSQPRTQPTNRARQAPAQPASPFARSAFQPETAGRALSARTSVTSHQPPVASARGNFPLLAAAESPEFLSGSQSLPPLWPAWFGVRLAHLITLTDRWDDLRQLGSLQALLNQEILMSDAAMPHDQHQTRTLDALSRRHALMTLAALPAALITPATVSAEDLSRAATTELFLARCATSLAACWHLLRGSDLMTVEQALSAYLLPLDAAAQQDSKYQAVAARLATQAHRICGIIALHGKSVELSLHHCSRALRYAAMASDPSNHASALISLASKYFYATDPLRAAAVYEQAFSLGAALPALLQSRVHAELAVVYAQLGREQDAVRGAGLAEDLYPDRPDDEPCSLYAEFTPASLVLEQGLAYIALAERFPGHGYQQKAADTFSCVEQSALPVPDRIRFEIVNQQAHTAVLLEDLDAFASFMYRGLEGVALLGSRQRLKEMKGTWRRALARWPGEQRLLALGDGLRQTAGPEGAA